MTAEPAPFGSALYLLMLALLLVARGADFLSTWIATPRLVLEGNPAARKLGWKWGTFVNLAVCLLCATIPVASVVIITTSLLVAARNFQSAWLMHSMGEEDYRDWHVARLRQTPTLLFGACLAGQVVLVASVGVGLVGFSPVDSVPFAIGLGIITYALAVALYTTLAAWRIRRTHDS